MNKMDARFFLITSNVSLLVISTLFFGLQRAWEDIFFAFSVGILTELFFFKKLNKYKNGHSLDRSVSAIAEVSSLLILFRSPYWWFVGAMSFITITAKYVLKKTQNTHIFNPTNFAIIVALVFFPYHWFAILPDEFMMSLYPIFHVVFWGGIAIWLGKTWQIAISFFVSTFFWCIIFFPIHNLSTFTYSIGPELGSAGVIFMFLMITDPKSAPQKKSDQIFFGALVGFIHVFLRYHKYMYSRYMAGFLVAAFFYGVLNFQKKVISKQQQKHDHF